MQCSEALVGCRQNPISAGSHRDHGGAASLASNLSSCGGTEMTVSPLASPSSPFLQRYVALSCAPREACQRLLVKPIAIATFSSQRSLADTGRLRSISRLTSNSGIRCWAGKMTGEVSLAKIGSLVAGGKRILGRYHGLSYLLRRSFRPSFSITGLIS